MVKCNVVLIGMPGSGKSTIGKLLARMLMFEFIDCDAYIEQRERMRLQQILDKRGVEEFKRIERARLLELNLSNYVIAPGGSIVYYFDVIQRFKNTSIFVFLDVPLDELQRRVQNIAFRGVIGLKTKTFSQLLTERMPLYLKYADVIIQCKEKTETAIAEEIRNRITRLL